MFITFDPFINIHKKGIIGIQAVVLRHDGFSAILVYVKNLQNDSPITNVVQSSQIAADDVQIMRHKTCPTGRNSQSNFEREVAKQDVSQVLSSQTDHNETWYMDP